MYTKRKAGDVIKNDAILLERVNGRLWKIKCKCGNTFVSQPSTTSGRCKKCGYALNSATRTIHGESPSESRRSTRLYGIWLLMKQRCENPNRKCYKHYGGRGIVVCDEWSDYLVFKKWALDNGYKDGLSIDRIDSCGNYSPDNCRWATQKEQGRNRRNNHLITFNGETKTMAEWSEICKIPYGTLKARISKYGFSPSEALTIPVKKRNNQSPRKDRAVP